MPAFFGTSLIEPLETLLRERCSLACVFCFPAILPAIAPVPAATPKEAARVIWRSIRLALWRINIYGLWKIRRATP